MPPSHRKFPILTLPYFLYSKTHPHPVTHSPSPPPPPIFPVVWFILIVSLPLFLPSSQPHSSTPSPSFFYQSFTFLIAIRKWYFDFEIRSLLSSQSYFVTKTTKVAPTADKECKPRSTNLHSGQGVRQMTGKLAPTRVTSCW